MSNLDGLKPILVEKSFFFFFSQKIVNRCLKEQGHLLEKNTRFYLCLHITGCFIKLLVNHAGSDQTPLLIYNEQFDQDQDLVFLK